MDTFSKEQRGSRVKDERIRLGMTQQQAADACGVKRLQWIRYEKGEQRLDGDVLNAFVAAGADATYILTGLESKTSVFSDDEIALILMYRKTNAEGKLAIDNIAKLVNTNNSTQADADKTIKARNSSVVSGTNNTVTNTTTKTKHRGTKIDIGTVKGDVVSGDKHVNK